jgi:hypothetical protein
MLHPKTAFTKISPMKMIILLTLNVSQSAYQEAIKASGLGRQAFKQS